MIKKIFFSLGAMLAFGYAYPQGIQIELGPDQIGQNQTWTITITVNNARLNYDNFPDVEGLQKRGTSSSSQTNIINGQMSSSQSIIMTYVPLRQGVITVPPFKMKVNDQFFSVPGKKVKVGPPVQVQQTDPFRSFFDRDPTDFFGRNTPTEFVDIKEDALLALTTNKDEVYVGEGFTATLSFLIADNNRAPMQFHDLGKQLSDILKKLRPGNCWEENFNIENRRRAYPSGREALHAVQNLPGRFFPAEFRGRPLSEHRLGDDQIQGGEKPFVLWAKPARGLQNILHEVKDGKSEGTTPSPPAGCRGGGKIQIG